MNNYNNAYFAHMDGILALFYRRSTKMEDSSTILMLLMKNLQAGCVSSIVRVTEANKTYLPSSTAGTFTTAHSRTSLWELSCWCGTRMSTHNTLGSL